MMTVKVLFLAVMVASLTHGFTLRDNQDKQRSTGTSKPRSSCPTKGLARQMREIRTMMEDRLDRENSPAAVFLLLVTHAMVPTFCLINLMILCCVLYEAGGPRGEAMELTGGSNDSTYGGYPDFGVRRSNSYLDLTVLDSSSRDPAPPSYEQATTSLEQTSGQQEEQEQQEAGRLQF